MTGICKNITQLNVAYKSYSLDSTTQIDGKDVKIINTYTPKNCPQRYKTKLTELREKQLLDTSISHFQLWMEMLGRISKETGDVNTTTN